MEATHPEYAPSQQELNFVPAAPLEMADRHILTKQAIHELARQAGLSATFMAKYSSTLPGSSCHIHSGLFLNKGAYYEKCF
jgi:glutamine synthetase